MSKLLRIVVFALGAVLALMPLLGATQAQESPEEIGTGSTGQTAIEFIGHINQSMFDLTSYGYITHLGGIPSELLFAPDTPAMFRSEAEARFTFMASGTANGRSNYENIFAATTSATFNIYYNESPDNISFDDPESFARGARIASFEGRLYSVLNVQEPDIGVLLVHSDTVQTAVAPFTLGDQSYQLGHLNQLARFTLFGQGFRSSTDPLAADYHVAGDVVTLGTLDEE